MAVYVSYILLMLFFYDSLPILTRVYTLKKQVGMQFCPLYFSTDFNVSSKDFRAATWYTINDTYNGHRIQCIGRSPYIIANGTFIENCLPSHSNLLCDGIEL